MPEQLRVGKLEDNVEHIRLTKMTKDMLVHEKGAVIIKTKHGVRVTPMEEAVKEFPYLEDDYNGF